MNSLQSLFSLDSKHIISIPEIYRVDDGIGEIASLGLQSLYFTKDPKGIVTIPDIYRL